MSVLSSLPNALFESAALLEFKDLPPRMGHGIAAHLFAAAALLHAAAALYHHIAIKGTTLKRMWFRSG